MVEVEENTNNGNNSHQENNRMISPASKSGLDQNIITNLSLDKKMCFSSSILFIVIYCLLHIIYSTRLQTQTI